MKHLVILNKSKYGYDIHVPGLPGCHSQGDTEKEALENIKEAIELYLEEVEPEIISKSSQIIEIDVPMALKIPVKIKKT